MGRGAAVDGGGLQSHRPRRSARGGFGEEVASEPGTAVS